MTQATIHDTICQRAYTAKVRPPRKVTDAINRRLISGHAGAPADYELDHLIPLGLGGHPTSANNLWLQNWSEAAMKGREELRLHREVCAGRMTLEQAQHDILATLGAAVNDMEPTHGPVPYPPPLDARTAPPLQLPLGLLVVFMLECLIALHTSGPVTRRTWPC